VLEQRLQDGEKNVKYTNYTDYSTEQNMYAMHKPIRSKDTEQMKYFEELFPEEEEELETWLRRTARHVHKLTEYAYHQHIYGTKRTWSCHESSRYCFICTLSNLLQNYRNMAQDMHQHIKTPLKWVRTTTEDIGDRGTIGEFRLKPIS